MSKFFHPQNVIVNVREIYAELGLVFIIFRNYFRYSSCSLFVHIANSPLKQIPFLNQLMLNMMNSFCNLVSHKSATPKVVGSDTVILWKKNFNGRW